MAQAPFFKVYLGKARDLSELVESFKYEDTIKEDSLLKITIKDDYALSLADDNEINNGSTMTFQFGFLGGEISELHRARITDIKHKYRDRVTMEIICLDIGTTVRKVSEQKIWKNKTSTEIAKEIADKYGLVLEADTTTKKWDNLPQGNKSDFQFLNYLAEREEGGNYIAYIRNNTMFFVKRGLDRESVLTFTYGDGNGTVIYFEPSFKDSGANGGATQSVAPVFDPYTGTTKPQVVDNNTESKTGTLGSYKSTYNGNGVNVGRDEIKGTPTPAPKKTVVTPTSNPAEAKNLANSKKKSATLKTLVAKLVVAGQPLIVPNSVITMKGVAKKHAGNWFVEKVTHDITSSGYVTTLDLAKNGLNSTGKKSSAKKASDSNKSVGKTKSEDTVKLVVYDGMGKKVGYSSQNKNAKKNG